MQKAMFHSGMWPFFLLPAASHSAWGGSRWVKNVEGEECWFAHGILGTKPHTMTICKTTQELDAQILQTRLAAFNAVNGPRVGDYIKLPYGLYTQISHDWGDQLQTGSGSLYLGHGYCSFSGGMERGVKSGDLVPTDEKKEGQIWFFSRDYHTAHNGVYLMIDFRVYELREGADLSGLPQIKEYERQQILKRAAKMKYINGNGKPYLLPLPRIVIPTHLISEWGIEDMAQTSGLKFERQHIGYVVQPMTYKELAHLLVSKNFKWSSYNNWTFENSLMLSPNANDLKQGIDLSWIPKLNKHIHQSMLKNGQSIKLLNDNGIEDVMPLPQIIIPRHGLSEYAINQMEKVCGIKFKKHHVGYMVQPKSYKQFVHLLLHHNFKTTYYSNWEYDNVLMLSYNRD